MRYAYEKPAPSNRLGGFFNGLAIAASILGFFGIQHYLPDAYGGISYAIFMWCILVVTGIHLFVLRQKNVHRYFEATQYCHYAVHRIRDIFAEKSIQIQRGQVNDSTFQHAPEITQEILDAVSLAFTIITGHRCDVCIKTFTEGGKLQVQMRDSWSRSTRGQKDRQRMPHPITSDTPCYKIFTAEVGHENFYGCNDVVKEYLEMAYKSPSLDPSVRGEPKIVTFLGYSYAKHWPLGYKSCMVLPIRYCRHGEQRPTRADDLPADPSGKWTYWGFLCIDSKQTGVFDFDRSLNLAATFADALFIYFNQLELLMDMATSPPSDSSTR